MAPHVTTRWVRFFKSSFARQPLPCRHFATSHARAPLLPSPRKARCSLYLPCKPDYTINILICQVNAALFTKPDTYADVEVDLREVVDPRKDSALVRSFQPLGREPFNPRIGSVRFGKEHRISGVGTIDVLCPRITPLPQQSLCLPRSNRRGHRRDGQSAGRARQSCFRSTCDPCLSSP